MECNFCFDQYIFVTLKILDTVAVTGVILLVISLIHVWIRI